MRIKDFVHEHFKHFNAAALVDAASGYAVSYTHLTLPTICSV